MPVLASTKKGAAVAAFPDVCVTPSPGGPVPVPYPTTTGARPGAQLPPIGRGTAVALAGSFRGGGAGLEAGTMKSAGAFNSSSAAATSTSAVAVQSLRTKLGQLHTQLGALQGTDPNRWHTLLDEYVIATANLYKALAGG
jgi:hypothetical protein